MLGDRFWHECCFDRNLALALGCRLCQKKNAEKKLAVTVFSFPPDKGNVGTAAYLNVFGSIYKVLESLRREGYNVGELPANGDELIQSVRPQSVSCDENVGGKEAEISICCILRQGNTRGGGGGGPTLGGGAHDRPPPHKKLENC
jgi:hypothetical protein